MSTQKATARMRRTEAQARFSDVFDDALHSTKTKQAEVARCLGIASTKIGQWIDDEERPLPTLADVACMPRVVARELLRALAAEHGFVVAEAPRINESREQHILRVAECQRESTEASVAYLDGLADGTITKAEARRIRKEHLDAFEKNAEVMAAMDVILMGECA